MQRIDLVSEVAERDHGSSVLGLKAIQSGQGSLRGDSRATAVARGQHRKL